MNELTQENDSAENSNEQSASENEEDVVLDPLSECLSGENYDEDNDPDLLGEYIEDDTDASYVSATVYTGPGGKIAVPQHVHYAHRGPDLEAYNLYNYSSVISIIPRKQIGLDAGSEQIETNESLQNTESGGRRPTRGRPVNGLFLFANTHPLHETHVQRLRSKPEVPVPICPPPSPPPPRPSKLTEEWKREARRFIRYILVLFKPWAKLPGPLTWKEMCNFINGLENGVWSEGPTPVEIVCFRQILNMAHGLRVHSKDRSAVSSFRNRAVTIWGRPDGTAPIGVEKNSGGNRVEETENDTELEENEAQVVIDLLRAETAVDNLLNKTDIGKIEFLSATAASLKSMEASPEERNIQRISNSDAERLLHVNQTGEPDIQGARINP